MPQKNYDILIIGGGPAGQSVATAAARAGKTVAMTEGYAYGGACPLRGCDPKMVLHGVADAADRVHLLHGKGFPESVRTHWPQLMAWKRTFTEPIPPKAREKLRDAGIDIHKGWASFLDEHTVLFGEEEVRGETIVIATGGKPAPLDIPGIELTFDSEDFLDMDDLPDELLFIGGGYIGMGFAHIAQAMGARVTIVAADDYALSGFDRDLAKLLRQAAEERGMEFRTNAKVTRVAKHGSRVRAQITPENGEAYWKETDRVIHCAGRVPMLDNLGLENAGVYYTKQGIKVSDRLQTSVPHIYALGDCADSGLPLTPVATQEASILADNLFRHGNRKIDYYPIPTVCFCLPPIAAVGLTAEQVADSDKDITTNYGELTDHFTARRLKDPVYAYKTFVDADTQEILGAHLIGPRAEEVINLFTLAIHQKITVGELKKIPWTYPTTTSDLSKMLG